MLGIRNQSAQSLRLRRNLDRLESQNPVIITSEDATFYQSLRRNLGRVEPSAPSVTEIIESLSIRPNANKLRRNLRDSAIAAFDPSQISGLQIRFQDNSDWTGQFFQLPSTISLSTFTIFIKFKITSIASDQGYWFGDETPSLIGFDGATDTNRGIRFFCNGSSTNFGSLGRTDYFNSGNYHTLALTKTGTTVNWNINNGNETGTFSSGSGSFNFKYVNEYSPGISRRFPGRVPLRLVYDSVLSSGDLASLHTYALTF